jgi:hypothetical protein
MKLWLVKLAEGARLHWDSYDALVIAAKTKAEALEVKPGGDHWPGKDGLTCTYLGKAKQGTKPGIILSDYKAA